MRPPVAVWVSAGFTIALCAIMTSSLGLLAREPGQAFERTHCTFEPMPLLTSEPLPLRPSPPEVPIVPPEEHRCCICAMEDARLAQREHKKVFAARYLGVFGRYDEDGERTGMRCRPGHRVWATVRFALVGESPWQGPDFTRERMARMRMALPCPELSRDAYIEMFPGEMFDSRGVDGVGSAPVLQRGQRYQLTVVDGPDLDEDPTHPEFVWTLLSVDPQSAQP